MSSTFNTFFPYLKIDIVTSEESRYIVCRTIKKRKVVLAVLWKVFFNKQTNKELCRFSVSEIELDEEGTKDMLAAELKTTPDNIQIRIEYR